MENPEEILHSLEEFSKMKPKDIPRELEEYLCYVAKTGNPVYQWPTIKSLFREKLLNVITEFYESCPAIDIPPCPNVELFNYDLMKNFILEKLDTFSSAPFTVQRICELLTTPRKEYNRIDKYMRALEKNILVVSTTEPGRRSNENGEGIMNGIESEHLPESSDSNHDINVEEMDESPSRPRAAKVTQVMLESSDNDNQTKVEDEQISVIQENFDNDSEEKADVPSSSTVTEPPEQAQQETVITCHVENPEQPYVSIEAVSLDTCSPHQDAIEEIQGDISVTITAMPAGVQQRRSSVEKVGDDVDTGSEAKAENEDKIVPEDVVIEPGVLAQEAATEQILTSESCSVPAEETTKEEPVLQLESVLLAETDVTESVSAKISESSKTLQIEICSESERNEPETTDGIIDLQEDKENEKTENDTDIVSSGTEEMVEKSKSIVESSDSLVLDAEVENIADSSTSLEEISEGPDKVSESDLEGMEKVSEAEEAQCNNLSTIPNEAKVSETSSVDIPMEVDIVSETDESEKKLVSDEPSSTSTDNTL